MKRIGYIHCIEIISHKLSNGFEKELSFYTVPADFLEEENSGKRLDEARSYWKN